MKANEYKAWYRRNDPQNARKGWGAYNRPYKERYERPPEYAVGSDAYKHYPAMVDIAEKQEAYLKEEDDSKKAQSEKAEEAKKQRAKRTRANQATRGVAQAIAAPVAGVVAGAVILVGGFQAIENASSSEPLPIIQTVECDWGEDYMSATITLTDENGTFVAELPATITVSEESASCTEAGTKTYTATAVYGEKDYSKVHSEEIAPTGHTFGEGHVVVDGGQTMMVYDCDNCDESVSIAITIEENDE